jgi:hypothetical protein
VIFHGYVSLPEGMLWWLTDHLINSDVFEVMFF